jgi:hypothetical protein
MELPPPPPPPADAVPTLIKLIAVAILVIIIVVFDLIYYQLVVYLGDSDIGLYGEWHDSLWRLSMEDFKCLLASFIQALLPSFFQPSSNTLAASGSLEPLLSNVQARTLPPLYFVCHIGFNYLQYIDWYLWIDKSTQRNQIQNVSYLSCIVNPSSSNFLNNSSMSASFMNSIKVLAAYSLHTLRK